MSCKLDFKKPIKWEIDVNNENSKIKGNKILDSFYHKNEYSGNFDFKLKNNKMVSSLINFKGGGSSSVETVKGMVNFHTHNFPNYISEECIFGSPSGDDMRECVRFGLEGNLCHLVFALEGTYVIQVNPCYLNILKRKNFKISEDIQGDVARGVVAFLIETYFKATHGHRCVDYNKNMEKKKLPICTPVDWVNFANKFKFENFFTKKNVCSKNLPCNGVPNYNSFGKSTVCPIKYMNDYGTDGQFKLNQDGIPLNLNSKKDIAMEVLTKHMSKLVSIFDKGCPKGNSTILWNRGQWFNVKFFSNKFNYNNEWLTYTLMVNKMKAQKGKTTETLFKYLKICGKQKDKIKFDKNNLPYIKFFPLNKPTCRIETGKEVLRWLKTF